MNKTILGIIVVIIVAILVAIFVTAGNDNTDTGSDVNTDDQSQNDETNNDEEDTDDSASNTLPATDDGDIENRFALNTQGSTWFYFYVDPSQSTEMMGDMVYINNSADETLATVEVVRNEEFQDYLVDQENLLNPREEVTFSGFAGASYQTENAVGEVTNHIVLNLDNDVQERLTLHVRYAPANQAALSTMLNSIVYLP